MKTHCLMANHSGNTCPTPSVNELQYKNRNVGTHEFKAENCPNHATIEAGGTENAATSHQLITAGFKTRAEDIKREIENLQQRYRQALQTGGTLIDRGAPCHVILSPEPDPSGTTDDSLRIVHRIRHLESAINSLEIIGGEGIDLHAFRATAFLVYAIDHELSTLHIPVRVADIQSHIAQHCQTACDNQSKHGRRKAKSSQERANNLEQSEASIAAARRTAAMEAGNILQLERRRATMTPDEAEEHRRREKCRVKEAIKIARQEAERVTFERQALDAEEAERLKKLDVEKIAEQIEKIESEAEEKRLQDEAKAEEQAAEQAETLRQKKVADAIERERRKIDLKRAVAAQKAADDAAEAAAKEVAAEAEAAAKEEENPIAAAKAAKDPREIEDTKPGVKPATGTQPSTSEFDPVPDKAADDAAKDVALTIVADLATSSEGKPWTEEEKQKVVESLATIVAGFNKFSTSENDLAVAKAFTAAAAAEESIVPVPQTKEDNTQAAERRAKAAARTEARASGKPRPEVGKDEAALLLAAEAAKYPLLAEDIKRDATRHRIAQQIAEKTGKHVEIKPRKVFVPTEKPGGASPPAPPPKHHKPKPKPGEKPPATPVPGLYTGPPSLATLGSPDKPYRPYTAEVVAQDLADTDSMAGHGPDDLRPEPTGAALAEIELPSIASLMGAPYSTLPGIVGSPATALGGLGGRGLYGAEFASPTLDPVEPPVEVNEGDDPLSVVSPLETEKVLEAERFKRASE